MIRTPIPVIERNAPTVEAIRAAIRRILDIEDERRIEPGEPEPEREAA